MRLEYKDLDWVYDESVRDTGPFVEGASYGTHPAVRIYYSPVVMEWLRSGRRGDIADGAMIVKEMYLPPARLYQELKDDPRYRSDPEAYEDTLGKLISGWTVMVRDQAGSKDGWFWAGVNAPEEGKSIDEAIESQLDDYSHILYSAFGAPCLRCHASADSNFTFASLNNIEGPSAGEGALRFRVDNSWRSLEHLSHYPLKRLLEDTNDPDSYVRRLFALPSSERPQTPRAGARSLKSMRHHLRAASGTEVSDASPLPDANPAFAETFRSVGPVSRDVRAFPSQWADHVVAQPHGPDLYLTSDNCLGCHGGLGGSPSGVTMFLKTGPQYGQGFNVSEYGEWRWSPMGLAGRDPIFHAQLESEMALLERDGRVAGRLVGSVTENQRAVTNTCLSCHGAMGQRQLQIDAASNASLDPNFKTEYFYLTEPLTADRASATTLGYHKYGELAREGISCTVCHHITAPADDAVDAWRPSDPGWITADTPKPLAYLLYHNTTGRYASGPSTELFGPFEDVAERPMENALGITPRVNTFTTDSQMCGTCHTIDLPNIGQTEDRFPVLTEAEQNPALQPYAHTIEQATFLEWQNSAFASGETFRSCQDCHMPGGFRSPDDGIDIDQIVTRIATIQDTTYPQAEHSAPAADIEVPMRPDYKRHEHVGLNVFLLEMFDQFPSILGVAKTDYMTGSSQGNRLAIDNMLRQARNETVDLGVEVESFERNVLTANVTVTNKTGHRFPSGVAFRRAFLEFLVLDGNEVIWSSGRTNAVGVIVNGAGRPLETEFLPGPDAYQHHHQVITAEDQVQIYEELNQNADREFTTSFIHRVHPIKDNRLLPKGWRSASFFEDQGEVMHQFMQATDPEGEYVRGNPAENIAPDPDYQDQGPDFPGRDRLRYKVTLPEDVGADRLSVRVTMYYQAIPPYWLHQRFSTAPNREATRRLYYIASRLDLTGSPIEGWKLPLVSANAEVE